VLLLATLLPLALLSVSTIQFSADTVRTQAERRLGVASRAAGVAITQQMNGLAELVMSYAQRPSLVDALVAPSSADAGTTIRSHLEGLRLARTGIDVAFVADPDGRLIDVLPETPDIIGADFSHRDWYRGVTTTGDSYVSELYRSAVAGEPLVVAAASPIREKTESGDRLLGILVAAYSTGTIQSFVDGFEEAEEVHLTVYDQRGTVVAEPNSNATEPAHRPDDPLVAAALAGRSGIGVSNHGGVETLLAYTPVEGIGWSVTAELPLDVALADADRVRNGVLIVSVLLAIIALGVIASVERSLRRRDEAEELLRGSEAFLDSVVENIPNMVFVKDAAELRFVRFNRAGEDLIGQSRDQLIGKNDFDLFPEDQATAFTEKDRAVLESGELVDIPSEPIDTANGRRLLHTRKIPILDETGAPRFLLGISDDITEREDAKRSLEEARDVADRANRAKSEFLSRMSHELRTPLNSVLGFSQILALDELTADQADNVELIRRAGRHLLTLIDEVLEIAQIESGRLRLSLEPVQVKDVVNSALDLVRPAAAQAGVTVPAAAENCEVWMTADRQRLLQVMLNLFSNAIKYNRSGGSVSVLCEQSGGTVAVGVTDTGIGISPSNVAKLFTPFERLGAEQSGVEGTGVGLALSRVLSQQMGGSLTVSSTVGVGSTFTLEMPVAEPTNEDAGGRGRSRADRDAVGLRERIVTLLAIEDNVANLRVVERAMATRGGVELLSTVQGSLGIDLARQHQPDLILLDLHLPDIPGREVFARLSGDPTTAGIPVVICTADATPGEASRLLEAGAAAYLTKPIDLVQLFELIELVRRSEPIDPIVIGFDRNPDWDVL